MLHQDPLGTLDYFAEDLLVNPIAVTHGRLDLRLVNNPRPLESKINGPLLPLE